MNIDQNYYFYKNERDWESILHQLLSSALKEFFFKFAKKVWKEACNTQLPPHIPHHHHPLLKTTNGTTQCWINLTNFKTLFVFRFSVLLKNICGMHISCPNLGLACPVARADVLRKNLLHFKPWDCVGLREERWGGPAEAKGSKETKTKMVAIQK